MAVTEKVSVIIPVLNQGKFIESCLKSLFDQGVEIICVDALSKDHTLDILEKYAEEEKIKLIYAKKRSYGYQMNLGLSIARGEYVAFMYPWQLADNEAFPQMITLADKEKLDLLQSEVSIIRRIFLAEQDISMPELPGSRDPLPEFIDNLVRYPLRTVRMKEMFFHLQELEKSASVPVEEEKPESGTDAMEYIFPFHLFPQGARIVIYGAEKISDEFYRQGLESGWVKPVAIIDSAEALAGMQDPRLVVQDKLASLKFDYVLLSNLDKTTAERQKTYLLSVGLKDSCIKWQGEVYRLADWQKNFYLPLLSYIAGCLRPYADGWGDSDAAQNVLQRVEGKKYVFVDLSYISKIDLHTGIQRVVNNTYWHMKELSRGGVFEVVPTQYKDGGLYTCFAYEDRDKDEKREEMRVELLKGEILFFLDSVWDFWPDMKKLVKIARKAGAKCAALFHDLICIRHPEFTIGQEANRNFKTWLDICALYMDICLCNSKTTAEDLRNYLEEMNFLREKPLAIHWLPMGSQFATEDRHEPVRHQLKKFLEENTFLMVGTVEIRKNCELVLEAFSMALREPGFKGRLLIIGKDGWGNKAAKAELEKLPKKNVLWLQDATDGELRYAYKHSCALVTASKAEGFGLPLIEAAQAGLPLIVSDIPIFHEVAGRNAIFFDNENAEELSKIMLGWKKRKNIPNSGKIKLHRWDETAEACLKVFGGKRKAYLTFKQSDAEVEA